MAAQSRSRRPVTLWTLSLIIALAGVYNLWLALDHLQRAAELRALGVSYPPLLRAGLALGWALLLLALAGGLGWRHRQARRWAWLVLSNYGAFGVLWMMLFAASDFGRGRIAFQAALTAMLVGLALWVLRWRRVRAAFAAPTPPTGPGDQNSIAGDAGYDRQPPPT